MRDWKMTTIAECSTILGDGVHGTPKYDEIGEYAFINGNNLHNGRIVIKPDTKRVGLSEYEKHKKELTDRTVLVSINGTLGNVAVYNGEKVILGKSACYFNVSTDCDVQFMRYVVSSPRFQQYINSVATGTTIKNVSLKQMREYAFPIPELKEQQRIAQVLYLLDQKIENNQKINDNLQQQAQALYQSWFVDYTPFGGIMPDAWHMGTLSDLADTIICGKTPSTKRSDYYGNEVPFITIPDMHNQIYAISTERSLSAVGASSQSGKMLPRNSICVSCIGTAGLVCLVAETSQTNQQINSIVPSPTASPYYIYLLATTLSDKIQNLGSGGSTICNLNKGQFSAIEALVPSEKSMQEFDEIVNPLFESIHINQIEKLRLAELRDTLLPNLMSGEIDVSDIQI